MTVLPRSARILMCAALLLHCASPARSGTLGESWFEYARITMSGQELNANFGGSVAISGDWAVIGASRDDNGPSNVGRVEFWQRVPTQGNWARRDIVYPPGATSLDLLGESVDIDGNFAVASAKGLDWLGAEFAGAAIVLQRSGTSWNLDGQLVDPEGPAEFMSYGDLVAIGGNTIAVGYRSATGGGLQRGRVDLFVRGASTWAPVQSINGDVDGLRIPDGLDLEADTLAFGADDAGAGGEVYIYHRSGGNFSLAQTLGPQSPTVGGFGIDLALNGDHLAVLAVDYLEIFERVSGVWQPLQVIEVPGLELGPANSADVIAFSGDRIHVTLQSSNDVLSFRFDGSQYQAETTLSTPSSVSSLGSANGSRLMIGHPLEDQGRGVVDVYEYALNTATSISVSPSPSVAGNATTISVTVGSDTLTPSGRVFIERTDGGFLCTIAPLSGLGSGSCTSTVGPPGNYEIVARYDANVGFADSSSAPFPHTVLTVPTTTTITSDAPDPSPAGTPVLVQYVVTSSRRNASPAGDPPPVPTGNVTISDGVDSCVGTVAEGQCTIVLDTSGARALVASYEGDSLFAASQSAAEPHTVVVAADLALDKRQCSELTQPNATHRFLLRVTNEGPSLAEAVELVDELPVDMAFVQASPDCSEASGIVTCLLGDLAPGTTADRVIEVLVGTDPDLSMINTASVTSLIDDPNLADNSDLTVTIRLDQLVAADGFEFCGEAP